MQWGSSNRKAKVETPDMESARVDLLPAKWPQGPSVRRSDSSGSLSGGRRSMVTSLLAWACIVLSLMVLVTVIIPSRGAAVTTVGMRSMKEVSGGTLDTDAAQAGAAITGSPLESPSTLVIYTYSKSDPEYERNLDFFVAHGMWEGDGCHYLIIVQQGNGLFEAGNLPQLPSNAQYVYHENKCYDWGTFGWALSSGKVDPSKYKHIIFMNSSIRGPFLPPYWPETVHWSQILTSRLTAEVKLVGATISCEPCWQGGNTANAKRHNAHVQSYFMATDQAGLKVLQDDGKVFACYDDMWDTIYHSEVGASRAVLNAGFTLDSLMLRYKGVDWRNQSNWGCNGELNPYAEYAYDGIYLNPMEVLFVKVKGFTIDGDWTSPKMAATYDRWISQQGQAGIVNSNDYIQRRSAYRMAKAIVMERRGGRCFDFPFYRARSKDLPPLAEPQLWQHFVKDGQFEGRPFRFTCSSPFVGGDKEVMEAAVAAAMQPAPHTVDEAVDKVLAVRAKQASGGAELAQG